MFCKVSIDFETRSTIDLKLAGAWKYSRDPSTSVNCMAWRLNDGPVNIWSRGEGFPTQLDAAIRYGYNFAAWNCQFERYIWQHCMTKLGWPNVPFELWRCTAAKSAYGNHPRKLELAAKQLLPAGQQKDLVGARVMRSMSKPVKKSKKNSHVPGLIWVDDPFSQGILESYCKQDVVAESALDAVLPDWPEEEIEIWQRNERVNDRGVPFDRELCEGADYVLTETMDGLSERISERTGGEITTGNQIQRIKTYIQERGINETCLDVQHVEALLETDLPDDVRDILLLRQHTSGSAAKKYRAALDSMDPDDHGRGLFMYYGTRTGRFASMKVQIQNMKHGADKTSDFRDVVCSRDMSLVVDTYNGSIISALGKNVRSLVCAPDGHTIVRCDSSQIEARVLSWLAGNEKMLRLFRDKADPYIDLAEKVFNKKVGKKDDERKIGKEAVLGLGFGMGATRFVAAVKTKAKIELTTRFAQVVVDTYRKENATIVKFWHNLEKAAKACVEKGIPVRVGRLLFRMEGDYFTVTLPSGRRLFYYKPAFVKHQGKTRFRYENNRGIRHEWAGGILCENIVQAVARDTLVHYMKLAAARGLDMFATVHDEIMLLAKLEDADAVEQSILECFATSLPWMDGLPCAAEAKVWPRYAD